MGSSKDYIAARLPFQFRQSFYILQLQVTSK